ncbi:hypothetical protein T190_30010 [Sinorhizobium meliloti CCBAU 01290]|nr:hypothetical protein T190_30010 [Sinorhizobium meliloti CCBAU 01290]
MQAGLRPEDCEQLGIAEMRTFGGASNTRRGSLGLRSAGSSLGEGMKTLVLFPDEAGDNLGDPRARQSELNRCSLDSGMRTRLLRKRNTVCQRG